MADIKKPWADGPFELIPASRTEAVPGVKQTGALAAATEMVLVHNMIIRGLNSIYLQAVNVSTRGTDTDKIDFTNYAYQWALTVHSHHQLEEAEIFPVFAKQTGVENIMDTNMEEHRAFDEGLVAYQAYLDEVKEGKESFDGEKLRRLIDAFMPTLHTHLHNEIDTLLSLKQYEDKVDIVKIFQDAVGKASGKAMKEYKYRNQLFPLVFNTHDKTFENGLFKDFPPIPWVLSLAIRWIFCRTFENWWRFAPCDSNSQPRDLPFV